MEVLDPVALWQLRREVSTLADARGHGTSLISLLLPPGPATLSKASTLCTTELGTVSSIKSAQTRKAVEEALRAIQMKVKGLACLGTNGLAIYCGVVGETAKKEMHIIEPIKPIQNFVYRCDSRFFVEPILSMFQEHERYGFIIIDGTGMMLATLQGNTRDVLFRYQVSLPKKHHKGGQSAVRFARLRLEARQNYVTKMEEACRLNFLDRQTNRPSVKALFLAGNADFKLELQKVLEPRLAAIVGGVFQIQYGGIQGLNHAIEQAGPLLAALPLVHQRAVLSRFFNEIARDTGLYVFGHQQVMAALEQGAVETLLLSEQLPEQRFEIESSEPSEHRLVRLALEARLADDEKVVAAEPLLDWLVQHHSNYGCGLELIGDATPEGQQFCIGFGGLGGLLRFPVPALLEEGDEGGEEDSDSTDDSFWN